MLDQLLVRAKWFPKAFHSLWDTFIDDTIRIIPPEKLYHGSFIRDVSAFQSDPSRAGGLRTLGDGLYCTDCKYTAINYALDRFTNASSQDRFEKNVFPTVYEIDTSRVVFAKLSGRKAMESFLPSFIDFLAFKEYQLTEIIIEEDMQKWTCHLQNRDLKKDPIYHVESLAQEVACECDMRYVDVYMDIVQQYLKKQGFGGICAWEGGEYHASYYPWIPFMTYAIFEPQKLSIIKKTELNLSKPSL